MLRVRCAVRISPLALPPKLGPPAVHGCSSGMVPHSVPPFLGSTRLARVFVWVWPPPLLSSVSFP
eukprot:3547459-Pyramimonas_sp.AAC.1